MSSPRQEIEEPTSSDDVAKSEKADSSGTMEESCKSEEPRPPAKRPLQTAVIEISDTESDDSDICAVTSYQASADEVKRIRGADYSSSSSSSSSGSYSSDSESPWEDDSILLPDEKPIGKVVKAQLFPRADRMEDPQLNGTFKSQGLIDRLTKSWTDMKDLDTDEITLTCEPFRLCLLHDLLANNAIINNIVDDMNTLDWTRKKMDLYEFHQTVDLANLTWQRSIKGIYELLKTEVMNWVSKITGLELTSVSASCSLYGPGDHLLVHDDLMGDRRVAFILYLTPWRTPPPPPRAPPAPAPAGKRPDVHNGEHTHIEEVDLECEGWAAHMGGALQLFERAGAEAEGAEGEGAPAPGVVRRTVYPRNNTLAFFQVGPETFHQVTEVLSLELPRLSINGWFHGPAPPPPAGAPPPGSPQPAPNPPPPETHRPHNEVVLMASWLEQTYMSPVARAHVQAQMERESEVCLRDFLREDKLQELHDALRASDVVWEWAGPVHRRRYERVCGAWLEGAPRDHPARALLALLSSGQFARLLHDCTDLAVRHHRALELQRWSPACYTLLPPRSHYESPRLEATLYLFAPPRALCGGDTVYTAPEERAGGAGGAGGSAAGEALVTVPPTHNALSLVYCDAGAAGFTKYLSRLTLPPTECFYLLTCTYTE